MIIILTTRRLRKLLRRSYNDGHDEGVTTGYRLGLAMRTVDNQNRAAAPVLYDRVRQEIDDIIRGAEL